MRGFGSSLEQISNKLLSAEAAVEVVKPGHRVFVGTASATPFTLVEALERRKPTPPDVELFYFLTTGLGHFGSSSNLLITTAVSSSARKCARSFTVGRP